MTQHTLTPGDPESSFCKMLNLIADMVSQAEDDSAGLKTLRTKKNDATLVTEHVRC